jgi:Otopetrin
MAFPHLQTTIQTLFILNGLRRSAATDDHELQMPGREHVTFLVVSNIALWAVNSFEVLRSESNPVAMEFFGQLPWSLITHVSVPLAIFYRFHSTVCLVDIWKEAYKPKVH